MTTELARYAGTIQDAEVQPLPSARSYGGRLYEKLISGGAICRCFQKAKEYSSAIYGRPYPRLSTSQVIEKYCVATGYIIWGGFWGTLATYLMIDAITTDPPPPDALPLGMAIPTLGFVDVISLASIGTGLVKIYKTCKAPREGENQALLPVHAQQSTS